MSKLELLKEAHKRGILPENKRPLFEEAVKRGLITIDEPKPAKRETNILEQGNATFWNTITGTAKDIKEAAQTTGNAIKEFVAPSEVEDLPELPTYGIGENFQRADTPEGMLKIQNKARREFRERYQDEDRADTMPLVMGEDKYGNPVAVDVDGNKFHFNKPGASINDIDYIKKGVDKYAPLIVGGSVSAPAKFIQGATTSGVTGGVSELSGQVDSNLSGSDEGYDLLKALKTSGYAALGDTAGRAIGLALGKVFSRFGEKTDDLSQFVTSDGKLTNKTIQLLKKNELEPDDLAAFLKHELKKRGDDILTPEQAARYNTLKSEKIEPTRPQVTQKANDFRAQQELAKTNQDVQERLAIQNARATGRVPELIEKTGAKDIDGGGLVNALTKKRLELDEEIGNIYTKIRESNPEKPFIKPTSLIGKLRKTESTELTKGVIGEINGKLKELGILDKTGSPVIKTNVAKGSEPVGITANQAEELRIFLNSLHDPKNPNIANNLIREIKDSLDIDVTKAGGKDFFLKARNLKKAERAEFAPDALKAHKFDRGSKNILDDISSGKVSPEKITDKIISKSTTSKDIDVIKKSLTTGTNEQIERGTQAWNDLRGEILDKGFQKATQKKGEYGPIWDRDIWKRYIDGIGQKKLSKLFTGEERAFLMRLRSTDDLLKPRSGTGIGEGPSTLPTNKLLQFMTKTPTGRAALGIKNTLDDAAKPVLDASNAQRILNPAEETINALKAYSESIRRGSSLTPRAGSAVGADEAR